MRATKPPVKLPVPVKHQCQLLLHNGQKCHNVAWAIMTRQDASTWRLCRNHAMRMKDQAAKYPDRFEPVRLKVINK